MTEPNFEGHDSRYCGEHRTVGPHRAWCYDCSEWCYPHEGCARCREPKHENEIARLRCNLEAQNELIRKLIHQRDEAQQRCIDLQRATAHGSRNPPEVIAELTEERDRAQRIATAYQNAAVDYRDMQDRAEGLEFQRDELRAIVGQVRELHDRPVVLLSYDELALRYEMTARTLSGATEQPDVEKLCKSVSKHDVCSMAVCTKNAEHDDDHMCLLGHRWSDREAQGDGNGDRG